MVEIEKLETDGLVLAARWWRCLSATRQPVVLLHGTGAEPDDWDEIAADLQADRTVVAVDLRGHGDSDQPGTYSIALMADDVASVLPRLAGPEVDLVGHSLGGLVACLVTAAASSPVRRLVLEDVAMPHPRPPAMPPRPDAELSFDWAVVEQVRPEIDNPAPHWPETMAKIHVPTLLIGGGPSSFVPQANVAELATVIPNAAVATIDAGHLVHRTRPRDFLHVCGNSSTGSRANRRDWHDLPVTSPGDRQPTEAKSTVPIDASRGVC